MSEFEEEKKTGNKENKKKEGNWGGGRRKERIRRVGEKGKKSTYSRFEPLISA